MNEKLRNMKSSHQKNKSFIQKYFQDEAIIIDQMIDIKMLVTGFQVVHLAQIIDRWSSFSERQTFKMFYLLFQISTKSGISTQFMNLLKEYNFKGIHSQKFGPRLDSPEKLLSNKIAGFLQYLKSDKISDLGLINSLTAEYQEYRILELFKQLPKQAIKICDTISNFINSKLRLIKQRLEEKQQKPDKMENKLQQYETTINDLRVITKRIEYLKCKYIKIDAASIQLSDMIKNKTIKAQQANKQQALITPQQIKSATIQRSYKPINIKKNLKSINNAIRKMNAQKENL